MLHTLDSGVLRDTGLAHHFRCAIATLFLGMKSTCECERIANKTLGTGELEKGLYRGL